MVRHPQCRGSACRLPSPVASGGAHRPVALPRARADRFFRLGAWLTLHHSRPRTHSPRRRRCSSRGARAPAADPSRERRDPAAHRFPRLTCPAPWCTRQRKALAAHAPAARRPGGPHSSGPSPLLPFAPADRAPVALRPVALHSSGSCPSGLSPSGLAPAARAQRPITPEARALAAPVPAALAQRLMASSGPAPSGPGCASLSLPPAGLAAARCGCPSDSGRRTSLQRQHALATSTWPRQWQGILRSCPLCAGRVEGTRARRGRGASGTSPALVSPDFPPGCAPSVAPLVWRARTFATALGRGGGHVRVAERPGH